MNISYSFHNSNRSILTCRLWLHYLLFKPSLLGSTQSSDVSAVYSSRVWWNKLWEKFHILVVWHDLVSAQNALGLLSYKWVLHVFYRLQYNFTTWLTWSLNVSFVPFCTQITYYCIKICSKLHSDNSHLDSGIKFCSLIRKEGCWLGTMLDVTIRVCQQAWMHVELNGFQIATSCRW